MPLIALADLPGFATDQQWMVDDAEAMALLAAPCLSDLDPDLPADQPKLKAIKAIMRGALLRWREVGNAGVTQRSVSTGPFSTSESYDTAKRRNMFEPSEINQLQGICSTSARSGTAGTIAAFSAHLPWCSLVFGATYCSCGVDIAGVPIFELEE